jgi:hypothetical protein
MNARLKGDGSAFERLNSQGARHIGGIHQPLGAAQADEPERQHCLRSIHERQAFFCF